MKGNVYLTGFMGTGKTTVGRALAKALGWSFLDTDAWIEDEEGATVAQIFARKGEPFFRRLEREAIRTAAKRGRRVVALGGGALLDERNISLISKSGVVVRLQCARDPLWERLKADLPSRPLLAAGDDPRENFLRLMRERSPFFVPGSMAFNTTKLTARQSAVRLARKLGLAP